jgi:hypothetical protein
MATPQVGGLAALTRQWLAQERQVSAPSAALVKALLLNGATSLSPGQYAAGDEVPGAWPNGVEGWGRASIAETVGTGAADGVWFKEHGGLRTGEVMEYALNVGAGEPLRVTLAWTDYPAVPMTLKALVNDLDLQVIGPDGTLLSGNMAASLPASCRLAGADRCNTVESLQIAAPIAGTYIIRARAAAVLHGPQPFALAVRAGGITDMSLAAPLLRPVAGPGPLLALSWSAVAGATHYQVQISSDSGFDTGVETLAVSGPSLTTVGALGTHHMRVRACAQSGCGEYSNTQSVSVAIRPHQVFLPLAARRG